MLRPLALIALVACSTAPVLRPRPEPGRPVVLLVHGRGMQGRDTAALRAMWRDALDSGATSFTRASLVQDADVRLVWYADVLDPRSSASCDYASDDPRARRDAAEDGGMKALVSFVGNVLDGLGAAASDDDSRTALRSLAADAEFLSDAHKRCAAEGRLAGALDRARSEGRPVILVAHSLGSIVAYDYLSAHRDSGLVQALVTVGSPLGSPDLRHLLIGGDDADTLTALASVKQWINVRNEGDPLATDVRPAHNIVVDTAADEPDPHELVGYLRESQTTSAVLGAWCDAFGARAPAACSTIPRQH